MRAALLTCLLSLPPALAAPAATVIPNGRSVQPAARRAFVGNFPLGLASTQDGRYLLVTNSGCGKQSVTVLDAATLRTVSDQPVRTLFNGLAVSRDGRRVWVCGGGAENVQVFSLQAGRLARAGALPCPGYPTSCALSTGGARLYVTCNLARRVRVLDTRTGKELASIPTGIFPFGIALTPDGRKAYVSNWADGTVSVLDLRANRALATLRAGGLPCAVALTPDGRTAYVANANTDSVTVIDTVRDAVAATLPITPYPKAPQGAMPNGLAVSPDGRRLYVTLAGINAVAAFSLPDRRPLGMTPTGWYPTGVLATRAGVFALASKGVGSGPNKDGGSIATMMRGLIERVAPPGPAGTRAVAVLNGLPTVKPRANPPDLPKGIKHVLFIVRENRSYDQVLGDYAGANGDPTLTLFGENVTPNLHALVRQFGLCDNMYGDGEVSVQGHQWTLGANCPDYVEKTWAALYSHRGRLVDSVPGPATYPAAGYMMDLCVRHGVTCRMYGDMVRRVAGGRPVPSMAAVIAPAYPTWNLSIPDARRAQVWLAEFRQGIFPQFSYIWLPNDHTAGATAGMPTPRAMVADNDAATGVILEELSRSPEWRDTVVFLTEDDTQDGRDHVDAHRDLLLVAGAWVKPGAVSSRHYSIASVYATIERLFNLPPMSQYDDLAEPVTGIWLPEPQVRAYTALPSAIPLTERNAANTPLARESARLDLDEPDSNTGPLLETILWRASKKK